MLTWRYHRKCPEGKIFDTEGREAPPVPALSEGWVEHRGDLNMTAEQLSDRMVENAVKAELARQGSHRKELENDHKKKYGVEADMRATNEEIANLMDNKSADGKAPFKLPSVHKAKRTR